LNVVCADFAITLLYQYNLFTQSKILCWKLKQTKESLDSPNAVAVARSSGGNQDDDTLGAAKFSAVAPKPLIPILNIQAKQIVKQIVLNFHL
jgi:hypothetical protein